MKESACGSLRYESRGKRGDERDGIEPDRLIGRRDFSETWSEFLNNGWIS